MQSMKDSETFVIGNQSIARGESCYFDLTIARLYDSTELSVPVCVIRGKEAGPVCFLSGSIHGDEIVGQEIIRRVLKKQKSRIQCGTLICVPIVNVFGYNSKSRYLPDRRDLNRCFPGNEKGSLGARLAHIFTKHILEVSHAGIDFHSGAVHKANLPQVRGCLDNPLAESLALEFGAPVVIDSRLRDGSLRGTADDLGIPVLVYEGGEALRQDEAVIKFGVRGALNCLKHLGMIKTSLKEAKKTKPQIAKSSFWLRAPQSGTMRPLQKLGSVVDKGSKLGVISDVFGKNSIDIMASATGVIIGENRLPLVNQGDALFHIATFEKIDLDAYWDGDLEIMD